MLWSIEVAFHVDEEDVVPLATSEGARFQFGHVHTTACEEGEHSGQGTGLVGQREEHGAFLLRVSTAAPTGIRGGGQRYGRGDTVRACRTNNHEARPVLMLVFDGCGKDVDAAEFAKAAVSDGS